MKSSNPRTYSRKRKEAAEAKFDAIFAPGQQKIMVEVDEVKKKRLKPAVENAVMSTLPNRLIKIEYAVNGANLSPTKVQNPKQTRNSAAEKFDALFGSTSPIKAPPTSSSSTAVVDSDDESIEITRKEYTGRSNETKYDVMFKKNEKSASAKFDALFGEDLPTMNEIGCKETKSQSPDFDNCFGFSSSDIDVEMQSQQAVKHGNQSPTKGSKPLPNITAATMKTVDGKVVLNIQRGGRKNSSPTKSAKANNCDLQKNKLDSQSRKGSDDNSNCSKNPYDVESIDQTKQKTKHLIAGSADKKNSLFTDAPVSLIGTETDPNKSSTSSTNSTVKKKTFRKFSKLNANSDNKTVSTAKPSYKSRPWMTDSEESTRSKLNDDIALQSLSQPELKSEGPSEVVPKLTRSTTWPENVGESIVTSIKCNKNAKAYFTVVKHVKNYQSCLEEGEAQEFEDEVEYLLEGLQPSQTISTRCLSATNLATKCQQHNFRLYLRAHNISMKVFSHLQDAAENKALALATSALLFMLSRDRRMEIDKITLQLLLKLLDPLERDSTNRNDSSSTDVAKNKKANPTKYKFFKSKSGNGNADDEKNFLSVRSKVEELVEASGDALLSRKDADMKRLASEALLRFTARRTTEWFREEIRIKGGLDHIILLVKSNVDVLVPSTVVSEKYEQTLGLLERILKVLENAIVNSPRNSMYLVTHQRALLLKKMATLLKLCQEWLVLHPGSSLDADDDENATKPNQTYLVLYNCITQIVRLLVNISNDNEWVSNKVGDQEEMIPCITKCILTTPLNLKESHRYETSLLGLGLLVNLVESSAKNRMSLMKMEIKSTGKFPRHGGGDAPNVVNVVASLVELFYKHESAARDNEVLGEEGVKKAVEAKRNQNSEATRSQKLELKSNPKDGRWVESEDGMEWVPADDEQSLGGSQDSVRSRNPEAGLTVEEKAQMQDTLSKANEHMEHSIMASHAALVLGCLIHGNRANLTSIRAHLRGTSDFTPMISMLKKFLSFMSMTAGMSQKGEKKLIQIIEDLEEVNIST